MIVKNKPAMVIVFLILIGMGLCPGCANHQQAKPTQSTSSEPDLSTTVNHQNSDEAEGKTYCVAIDPGHQSEHIDMSAEEPIGPGASETKAKATGGTAGNFSGIPEYALNLDVSLALEETLKKRGYRVVLTRRDNETAISNVQRAALATSENADIFIRIHANGAEDAGASGALAIVPSPENPYIPTLSAPSEKLADTLLNHYCRATGFTNLGVQYSDSYSGNNWATMPVVLFEMGFMSNAHDDPLMADSAFRAKMVEGLANGIDAYFKP
ncbi:MAG: N-acetylmuramoyl-L-alanine amidase [Eubacteriaceae bacterium]|nr:N-acetylmuramoyl-L-alanine amidase [Eubacteriaceae bacterium]